jgi:SAM-dependent methyltransferase
LVSDLVALTGLRKTHRVLEIGAGTGQLTFSLARQGFQLTALERGANLARLLANRMAPFPQVTVVVADFDTWDAPVGEFDIVVVATAFHWLDPSMRVLKCVRLLRPGGTLAIVDTRWGAGARGDRFAEESRACYARWDAGFDPNFRPRGPDDLPEFNEELDVSGLFETITHRRHFCRREYSARTYCELLGTFSNILAFDAQSRSGFLACIRELIEHRFDGSIVSEDVHDLWLARTAQEGGSVVPAA